MSLRFLPFRERPKLFSGDVVSTPLLREAIVQREVNGRWLLRYTDDDTEVVLQSKLLALVRRAAPEGDALLAAASKITSFRSGDGSE